MNTTQKLEFDKKILLNFEWWEITGKAWVLAIEEFCNKLWIKKMLKKIFPEQRKWNYKHSKDEIIYQKNMRIIFWMSSNNNYFYQKNDPIFQQIHENKIASSATCSRLEQTFNFSDIAWFKAINKILEQYNLEQSKTKEVIIDVDTTYDPASENLEFSRFNGHYSLSWFSPILAFNWLTWDFISWKLKPWNYHCSTLSHSFISDIINFYEENTIKDISFRLDSAFSIPKIFSLFEEKQVKYYSKLKSNSKLLEMLQWKWKRWISIFVNLEYKASSWEKSRRVVACIDWKPRETEESKKNRKKNPKLKPVKQYDLFPIYSFVVTNNEFLENEEIFSFYNGRATIENSIEEAKNGFNIDHLSNKNFKLNAVNFQIHLLALQITQLFRKFILWKESKYSKNKNKKHTKSLKQNKKFKLKKLWRKEIKVPHIQTLREMIFNIPARIVKTWRKIYYKCASSFVYKDLFLSVIQKIQLLKPLLF